MPNRRQFVAVFCCPSPDFRNPVFNGKAASATPPYSPTDASPESLLPRQKMGRPTGIEPIFVLEAKSLKNADLVYG
jgi:hypothetical protein